MLIWLWIFGYNWMPPVAFSSAIQNQENVHTVRVTAGQWFWRLEDGGYGSGPTYSQPIPQNESKTTSTAASTTGGQQQIHVKAGETVKFVARSQDVNHGFSILSSNKSMDSPLMQMQVVPGFDNVFYYTFDKPGTYTIRCLEYCGWNHPFMTSQITIYAS
jgi:heme/copper-type cytochrome/quinol oxidase subunit 2